MNPKTITAKIVVPRTDADLSAIRACIRALNKSTSRRMLEANLEFLNDRYIKHPSASLPKHLKPL